MASTVGRLMKARWIFMACLPAGPGSTTGKCLSINSEDGFQKVAYLTAIADEHRHAIITGKAWCPCTGTGGDYRSGLKDWNIIIKSPD